MQTPFYELHAHSEYSNTHLIDCINKVDALLDHAADIGLGGVALTDHECLSGHIKALNHLKRVHEKRPDFQLILGNEIYLCRDCQPIVREDGKTAYPIESGQFFHFILLARDAIGHRQLRELSSRAWSRCYSYKHTERLPTFYSDIEEIVAPLPGHLIASTACIGGEFARLTLDGDAQGAYAFVQQCRRWFGEDCFFVELQPGLSGEQRLFNRRAVRFCKHFGIPWIITNDVHYLSAEKRVLHENLLKSHEEDREAGDFYESTYFKTPDEVLARMREDIATEDILAGFANTALIAQMCKDCGDYGLFHSTIVPPRPIDAEPVIQGLLAPYYSACPSIAYLSSSPSIQDRFYLQECEKGLLRHKISVTEEVARRIDIEAQQLIAITEKLGGSSLTGYYNLMQYLMDIIWCYSIIGPGRGSAGCWFCAYLMGITSVNSFRENLPYWRHVHVSKVSLPDIDIDLSPSRKDAVLEAIKETFGRDRCLSIITFRTETLRSAIKTAARGIGLDNDTAQELSLLVPVTRGRVWSYQECMKGNEDNGFRPITQLIQKIALYPGLHETILEIEGLVSGRGIHASGFYLMASPYVEHNSLMKAANGLETTCWCMEDSDACGALKFDLLVTDACDKIQKCLELLLRDNRIRWQGNLKATYEKYLHPDVIDYTSPEMWDFIGAGAVTDLFQFMSAIGVEAVRKIKPRSLKELCVSSSVMRLMGSDGGMSPIDRYVAFKNDISLWYQEMKNAGLNESETTVLRRYLDGNCGVTVEQEDLMELSMEPAISGFDMSQADSLRKVLSKKQIKKIPAMKEMFFTEGRRRGTREEMLRYVWDVCFTPLMSYGFNRPHVRSYAMVAIQEANLFCKYPHIYWQCACLTVNAQADESSESNGSTNYGKIASAIGAMKTQGVRIALPDINAAGFGFTPDAENSQIIFGLKGLVGVGDDAVHSVLEYRPYDSLNDFLIKNPALSLKTCVSLVKAGCFDALENRPRPAIARSLCDFFAADRTEQKTSLSFQNLSAMRGLPGFIPREHSFCAQLAAFRSGIFKPSAVVPGVKPKAFRLGDMETIFFENELVTLFNQGAEYDYADDGGLIVYQSRFDRKYKEIIKPLSDWIVLPETAAKYNIAARDATSRELFERYFSGDVSKWEMDSLCFYYTRHPLECIDKTAYGISSFFDIPAQPVVERMEKRVDKRTGAQTEWPRYRLYRIAGTVLDHDNIRHTVTLLTPDGVVTVKFYAGEFASYNSQISRKIPGKDAKTIVEKSWFTRGTVLLVTGIRREDNFFPKKYYDSIYGRTSVGLIENIAPSGVLTLRSQRKNSEE